MAQNRYSRKEITQSPEIQKLVNDELTEFDTYIANLQLTDVEAVADFINSYLVDMINNRDDGLAELKYYAVCHRLAHILVDHIFYLREVKEMIEKMMGKSLQESMENALGNKAPERASTSVNPFKNRKYLN